MEAQIPTWLKGHSTISIKVYLDCLKIRFRDYSGSNVAAPDSVEEKRKRADQERETEKKLKEHDGFIGKVKRSVNQLASLIKE